MNKHVNSAPSAWMEDLDRNAAEIAAGQTVPIAPVLHELWASAERLEAGMAQAETARILRRIDLA